MVTVIKIDNRQVKQFYKNLEIVDKDFEQLPHAYSKELVKSLRRQLISQTKKAPRTNSARRITATKLSKYVSVVKMPMKLIYLDSMKPHYVSLKRGRAITQWARKYYGGMIKSGKSRVRRGKRGGISGSIYVTPDPFIETAVSKKERWLTNKIDRTLEKLKV